MNKLNQILLVLACISILAFSMGCGGAGGGSAAAGGSEAVYYSGVSPQVSVNRGMIPFKLTGNDGGIDLSAFRGDPSISLEGKDATIPGEDVSAGSGELTCSFDLGAQPSGVYDVVITDGRATQRLSRAFSLMGSVQAAVLEAASLYDGTALVDAYLPAGIYNTETEQFPIVIVNGVNLKGPGAGLLNGSTQRPIGENAVLDAEGSDRVIEIPEYTNFWGVTGIEITGGSADGYGGGIYWYTENRKKSSSGTYRNNERNSYSSMFITDCYIHDNYSSSAGAGVYIYNGQQDIPEPLTSTFDFTYNLVSGNSSEGQYGAGAYFDIENHRYLTNINNNEFSDNDFSSTECYGGGFYYYGSSSSYDIYEGTTNINHNTFDANICDEGYGGGAYIDELEYSQALNMSGNTFSNHSGIYWGGGCFLYGVRYGGTCHFDNNTFTSNTDVYQGGGLFIYDPYDGSRNFFTGNTFTGNNADDGGGAYIYNIDECYFNMTDNAFTGNDALNNGAGGGLHVNLSSARDFYVGNTFSENTGYRGAGFYYNYNGGSATAINSNTFTGNTAAFEGGGLYFAQAFKLQLNGNMFDGNTADSHGGGLYFDIGGGATPQPVEITSNTFTGNTVTNGQGGRGGGGIYFWNLWPESTILVLNKIHGNSALGAGGRGGGIDFQNCVGSNTFVVGGSAAAQNDIYGNSAGEGIGAQFNNNAGEHVNAQYNYWGGGAPAVPADVDGDVDTSNPATNPLP